MFKRLIKRKKPSEPVAPKRDLTNDEWERLVERNQRKAPKEEKTTKRRNTVSDYRREDAEIIGKYIIPKGRKVTKEFAKDMGISTRTMAKGLDNNSNTRPPKRVTIPKEISVNGTKFTKYCKYDGDINSAREAAGDMQEMGYYTRILKFQLHSYPTYVLYRYKKGRASSPSRKPTTKKRTIRK